MSCACHVDTLSRLFCRSFVKGLHFDVMRLPCWVTVMPCVFQRISLLCKVARNVTTMPCVSKEMSLSCHMSAMSVKSLPAINWYLNRKISVSLASSL